MWKTPLDWPFPTVAVAQLVESQIVVLDVAGSSPVGHPSFFIFIRRRSLMAAMTTTTTTTAGVVD